MCFCGGMQFQELNAQKSPASRGRLAFKSPYAIIHLKISSLLTDVNVQYVQ